MPHKRNPIKSEQLSGLARVLRGYLGSGLQDVALWHERDISHSSVERIILPDASLLAYYVLDRMAVLVDGLVVSPARMLANFDLSFGLVFSQPVLLALVASGLGRDAAYHIVQRDAMAAWDGGRPFRSVLEEDPEVSLDKSTLDEAFDLRRSLRHVDRVFAALDQIPPPDRLGEGGVTP
jgi:adenylosuccinate lyase